ncbi:ATP-dependent DNA helicase Q1, putative [Plasmodium malariae]|uniref:ATP-dependent DNA helicase n=1 Tax=Plasmodium malariae TaxID=5858 RepID=A0A1C3KBL4_PLAMA|nr:ATP-dependent DNA helicase Q1, putative [Plasmodium malariae]
MGEINLIKEGTYDNKEDEMSSRLLNEYKNKYANIDIPKATTILKEYFSFNEFKTKQIECLNAIKNFEHVLNITPTGGGKSLIYQVIPLLIGGISIVISPLISLIQDQILSLKKRNIMAETINSSLKKKENENILTLLKSYNDCNIKVLFITPETATSEYFIMLIQELYMNQKISLISIDEVHCISTWGCEFRKSYRNLNRVLKTCPFVRIYSCTATATKSVENDIILNLNLNQDKNNSLRIVRTPFNRPNLKYVIVYSDLLKIEKKKSVLDIINEKKNMNKIGIVYCFKRSTCDEISKYLREKGLQALSYHAGLTNNARKRIQEKWVKGNAKILVATIAFGMGIDRKDVSYIIHFNLPKSIENYYQESGRSGRNGNISFCYLYYSKEDVEKLSYIIKCSYANLDMHDVDVEKKFEKEMYKLECVHNMCINEKCIRSQILSYFGETRHKNIDRNGGDGGGGNGYNISGNGSGNNFSNDIARNYLGNAHNELGNTQKDETYCCSYCFDIRGSKDKIQQVIKLYEQKNLNAQFAQEQKSYNSKKINPNVNPKKHILSGDSYSDKEQELNEYKLTNKKIKGFVPFQSASSIISKEVRDKGIIEVMKELERREELMENKLEQESKDKSKKYNTPLHCVNFRRKPTFSSFKVPRKI